MSNLVMQRLEERMLSEAREIAAMMDTLDDDLSALAGRLSKAFGATADDDNESVALDDAANEVQKARTTLRESKRTMAVYIGLLTLDGVSSSSGPDGEA
jgi:hypothetical protein